MINELHIKKINRKPVDLKPIAFSLVEFIPHGDVTESNDAAAWAAWDDAVAAIDGQKSDELAVI